MKMPQYISKLFKCFNGAFINARNEFIAHPKSNLYFMLDDVDNEEDVYFKLLAWFSRAALKGQPYNADFRNRKYNEMILNCINEYCGTAFSHDDIEKIYCEFGNGVNEKGCREFIKRGFKWESE